MRLAALDIPAQPEFVSVARLVVSSIAGDRYELDEEQLDNLKLAVSEACVMAIESSSRSAARVSVNCEGSDDRIEVTIDCEGTRFDQNAVMSYSPGVIEGRDLDAELGVPLISSLVDELSIDEPTGHRMQLTVFSQLAEEL